MENMNRDGEEEKRGQGIHSIVQLPPNIYEIAVKPIFNRSRNYETKGEDYLQPWQIVVENKKFDANGFKRIKPR